MADFESCANGGGRKTLSLHPPLFWCDRMQRSSLKSEGMCLFGTTENWWLRPSRPWIALPKSASDEKQRSTRHECRGPRGEATFRLSARGIVQKFPGQRILHQQSEQRERQERPRRLEDSRSGSRCWRSGRGARRVPSFRVKAQACRWTQASRTACKQHWW